MRHNLGHSSKYVHTSNFLQLNANPLKLHFQLNFEDDTSLHEEFSKQQAVAHESLKHLLSFCCMTVQEDDGKISTYNIFDLTNFVQCLLVLHLR